VSDLVSPLILRLFGPFEVQVNGRPPRRLRSRKSQWLLALLALRPGVAVERSWLAGLLWPESGEPQALHSLRMCLTDLRQALGEAASRLRSPTPQTLALDLTGAEVDVLAFDAAIARGDPASLEEAIALYRGPLLVGCGEEWVFQERQAREQGYLAALERLAAQAMGRGEPGAAERHLRVAVGVDPLRESAQRGLMEALAAGGNYAATLLAYRELRLLLHRELNAAPDPETAALFQRLQAEAREKAALGSRLSALGESGGLPSGVGASAVLPEGRAPRAESGSEATLTFLFTDIESSTRLWEEHPEEVRDALPRHDTLLRAATHTHGGQIFKTWGDQVCAAFSTAPEAVAAALAAQRALHAEAWGEAPGAAGSGLLRVRMALHTGAAEERDGDYFGPPLNRVARLLEATHGGQIVLSLATQDLVREYLPEGTSLRNLGEHRLKDLQRPESIFQLVHPDLPAEFPPLRSLEAFAHNLPLQLTRFIGREREMAEVKRLLQTARLLTLTGAGGCGKTRLALQVAADLLEEYPNGVWLVELAALTDPALVPQTVAATWGVREEPGRPLIQTLMDYLRPRSLLLVLDNCEHVLAACAQLAEAWVRACPKLRILATSREGLGIGGEQTYRVPSLSRPDPQSLPVLEQLQAFEAVQLFAERAGLSQPSFAVTEANARAVAQVCHRLDGIPLALELAAARVKALPVETIAQRLDDRFRLLTGGSRTALPRQQTLRALIDWSYDLLTEAERALLRRLSVFSGGWTLEATEAVCARAGIESWEVLDLLTQLVEKSLVGYEEQEGKARYRLLETVRQYGRDRLLESGEEEAVRERHRDYFLALAEEAEPQLRGPQQKAWMDRLEREHDNLRAALEWSFTEEGGAEAALRLTAALAWFGWGQTYSWVGAGKAFARAFERRHSVREEVRVTAYVWPWASEELLEEGLALSRALGDMRCGARALLGLVMHAWNRGDYEAAQARAEEGLVLARESGDKSLLATGLVYRGWVALYQGDYEAARRHSEQGLTLARELGDLWLQGYVLNHLGMEARGQREYETARAFHEESLAIRRELGDQRGIGATLIYLGDAALEQEDEELARRCFAESLRIGQDMGNGLNIRLSLMGLGRLAWRRAIPRRAAHLWGAAECKGPIPPASRAAYERDVAAAGAALGEEAFAAAWAEGRAMPLEEVICAELAEREIPTTGRQGSEGDPEVTGLT
jgi:predicted ATPase/class 3 adenylate cyclase/DNA-binding SARP family transcriptional activator